MFPDSRPLANDAVRLKVVIGPLVERVGVSNGTSVRLHVSFYTRGSTVRVRNAHICDP